MLYYSTLEAYFWRALIALSRHLHPPLPQARIGYAAFLLSVGLLYRQHHPRLPLAPPAPAAAPSLSSSRRRACGQNLGVFDVLHPDGPGLPIAPLTGALSLPCLERR